MSLILSSFDLSMVSALSDKKMSFVLTLFNYFNGLLTAISEILFLGSFDRKLLEI